MPAPDHRSSPPYQTARERIAARRVTRHSQRRLLPVRRAAHRSQRWHISWTALGLICGGVLIVVGVLWYQAIQTLATIQQTDPRQRAQPGALIPGIGRPLATPALSADMLSQPFNILLVGVDKRPNPDDGIRSDTLILVHLDPQGKWASMLSIPRDSVVNIPHLGQAKINTAYAYGFTNAESIYGAGTDADAAGGALVAETVEQFLRVKVNYVAQVDFHGFEQLVDAVGGVPIDVTTPLLDAEYPTDDNGIERIYIPAGLQVMDGHTALVYARSRHSSSDFDRSKRQQQVLRALLDHVKARGLLENASLLSQWADVIARNVRTTLPVSNLKMLGSLAAFARQLDGSKIKQMSINPDDVAIQSENGSDIYWNRSEIRSLVARWQTGPQGTGETAPARIQVLNGAAVEGVASKVSEHLRSKGFVLTDAANALQIYAHTTIIDYTGRPDTRKRLADILGITAEYVQATPGPNAPPQAPETDIVVVVGQDYKGDWVGQ